MMSLLTLGWFGTTPVGALVIGGIADALSPPAAMVVAGSTCLVCAVALLVPPRAAARGPVRAHPTVETAANLDDEAT